MFWTQETNDAQCEFLLEKNDEFQKGKDDMKSDSGKSDAATNNGYILGLPFLRGFNIMLDFEKNKLGFANKLNNFGAIITSHKEKNAPETTKTDETKKPADPDHPELNPPPKTNITDDDNVVPDADPIIDGDDINPEDNTIVDPRALPPGYGDPDPNGMSKQNLYILIGFVIVLFVVTCALVMCCRKGTKDNDEN